ncbi:hypothetical protein MOMA_06396 [Moraxella macacae 0408225]|uniref:DUF697 domain-containing protein n=1 Tax=Moraxella macacae 0408225 TaxID=1230338 RepID=L2F553_9GAMM|nr:hypothetical protein [Moraxella macacae]ELA08169.1 hypothetical protein MOMA_06396 [Moraxella macacae 0408225]
MSNVKQPTVEQLPNSIDPDLNLEKVKVECEELVKKQAKISAGVAIVPVPFFDVAVDAGLLTKLLPEISQRFGLADDITKKTNNEKEKNSSSFEQYKDRAVDFAGLVATRALAKKTFQGFGSRIITKQVTKFVPFGGQLVAGTIGYLMFKKIANDHIEKCYQNAKKLQREYHEKTVN